MEDSRSSIEKKEEAHFEVASDKDREPGIIDLEKTTSDGPVAVQWTFARCVAIASLCIAYVGSQVLLYFTGGALTYIARDAHISLPSWLPNANLLSVASTLPFVGYFTDLIGRRYTVIVGAACITIGSILMASTYSFPQAIVAMVLGGIGAGICELTALAGVAEISPVRWRGLTLALVTVSILPFFPYVLYVNLLQKVSTWRWAIAMPCIWNFLGLFGLIFCYHPPPRHVVEGATRKDLIKKIDFTGGFLSISGFALLLVGLQSGGYQFPWHAPEVLVPLIIGAVLLMVFIWFEKYKAAHPMFPAAMFQGQKVVALSFVTAFVAGMNFYSILNFYPILLTNYYPAGRPIEAGIRAIGYCFSITAAATIQNTLLSFTNGHVREMLTICALLMTGCGGALAACTPFNPGLATALSTVAGYGIGGVLVPTNATAIIAAPDDWIATVTAISLSMRFIGGAIGNTIYFNIYNTQLVKKLPAYIAQYATNAGLPQHSAAAFTAAYMKVADTGVVVTAAALNSVPDVTPDIVAAASLGLRWAYVDSVKYIWYASIPFGVVACVCCAFMPNMKRFLTNRVAVDIH